MAFVAKEWKARLVEFAGRRTLTNVLTGASTVYDVARNEGAVSQEGDAFSAKNMNNLEQRISDAISALDGNGAVESITVENGAAYITYTIDGVKKKKKLGSGTLVNLGGLNASIDAAAKLAEYGVAKEDILQSHFVMEITGGSWSGFLNGDTGISGGWFSDRSITYNSSTGIVSTTAKGKASSSHAESTGYPSFSISGNYTGRLWYFIGDDMV